MKETTITFDEFLNREFGTIGTVKRKKADVRLNKIAKEQENKIRKNLKKQTVVIEEIKTELMKNSQQLPNINTVKLIGSIIGNDFNTKSDIDLLVDFKEFNLNEFLLIERKLKKLTGRKIQIIIENECNPLFLKLNPNRILIYKRND